MISSEKCKVDSHEDIYAKMLKIYALKCNKYLKDS